MRQASHVAVQHNAVDITCLIDVSQQYFSGYFAMMAKNLVRLSSVL